MSLISVQSSFRDVIYDVKKGAPDGENAEFWVSTRLLSDYELAIHVSKVKVSRTEKPPMADSAKGDLETEGTGYEEVLFEVVEPSVDSKSEAQRQVAAFQAVDLYTFQATLSNGKIKEHHFIKTPKKRHLLPVDALHKQLVTSLDVSAAQKLAILGTSKGAVVLYSLRSESVLRTIPCHDGFDVQKAVFFPSGSVVLTAGLDLQIKLWDLKSGACARRFLSHTKRINDIATLGKTGRNFVSCADDGVVKLWECGSGELVKDLKRVTKFAGVNCLAVHRDGALAERYESQKAEDGEGHKLEFETKGAVVFAGHQNGVITEWDVYGGYQRATVPSLDKQEVISIALFQINGKLFIAAGYGNGIVRLWDYKNLKAPVREITINEGISINFVKKHGGNLVVSSSNDTVIGIPVEQWLASEEERQIVTYAGLGDYTKVNVGCCTSEVDVEEGYPVNRFYAFNRDDVSVVRFQ